MQSNFVSDILSWGIGADTEVGVSDTREGCAVWRERGASEREAAGVRRENAARERVRVSDGAEACVDAVVAAVAA